MRALPKRIFVAGIGTGIGKTVASAVLAESLHADYWKPIQCGSLESTDSMIVQSLVSNAESKIYPEAHLLKTPASPHYAAKAEGIEISASTCKLPSPFANQNQTRTLIVEAAGGLLVPVNSDSLVIDLIKHFEASVVLISKNYLGSINHTLLSIEALKQRGIDVLGVIFNGADLFDNQSIITHFTQVNVLGKLSYSHQVDREFIAAEAVKLKAGIAEHYQI